MVENFQINCNYNYVNLTITSFNDGIHDTLVNVTFRTFVVLQKMAMTIKIRVPINEKDNNYQKEFFQTSIDLSKLYYGARGNYVTKILADAFIGPTSSSYKLFPMAKNFFYESYNKSIDSSLVPKLIEFKGLIESRTIGKVLGKKSGDYLHSWRANFKIKKS